MIKCYNDILKHLQIENIFITGNVNAFCHIIQIDYLTWIITTDKQLNCDSCIVNIKIDKTYLEIQSKVFDLKNNTYKIILRAKLK